MNKNLIIKDLIITGLLTALNMSINGKGEVMLSDRNDSAAGLLWNPGRYCGWRGPAADSVTHFYLSREKERGREENGKAAALTQTKNRHSQLQQEEPPTLH